MTNKQTNWWDNVVLWLTGSLPKKTRERISKEFKETVEQFQDLTEIAKEVAVAKSTEILEDIKEEIVEQVTKPKAAPKKTKLEQVKEDAARMQSQQAVAKTATPKKTSAGTGKVASSDVTKKPATPKKKKAE